MIEDVDVIEALLLWVFGLCIIIPVVVFGKAITAATSNPHEALAVVVVLVAVFVVPGVVGYLAFRAVEWVGGKVG
jgi:ABC-type transport system involved in cytochrome c biogenesis permease component